MASTTYLQQAYLAYFGRPADVSGLSFYASKTEAQVVAAFSASTESQAFFGSLITSAQIQTIYQNLFNRAAEPAGLVYWAAEINAGRLSLAQASMGILAGAQNDDKLAVTNKLAAATAFTAALDTSAEMIGYQGSAVITPARAYLASVGSTAASLTAATATAALNAYVATVVAAGTDTSTDGSTFTLTSDDAGDATGSTGDDKFIALDDALQNYVVDGGEGDDTLVATISASESYSVSNVESLSFKTTTANLTIDMDDFSDETSIIVRGSAAITTTLSNVESGTALTSEFTGTAALTATLDDASGEADSITLTLDDATSTGVTDLDDIETIIIVSDGSENSLTLSADELVTLDISGEADLTVVAITAANLETIDASAATGDLTFSLLPEVDLTFTSGSGDDSADMAGSTSLDDEDTIDMGDGEDTLTLDSDGEATFLTSAEDGDIAVSNVETLELVADVASTAIDFDVFADPTEFTEVLLTGADDAVDFTLTDIQTTTVSIRNTNDAEADIIDTVTYDIKDGSAEDDSLTLNLTGRADATDFIITTLTAALIEEIDIAANFSGEDADVTISTLTATSLTTLNISGEADFTITAALSNTVETVDGSDATGDLDITVGTSDMTITGGDGDDTFTFAATFDAEDVIDGGDGEDTVELTLGAAVYDDDVAVSNVEVLDVTQAAGANAVTMDLRDATSLTTLVMTFENTQDTTTTIERASSTLATVEIDAITGDSTDTLVIELDDDGETDSIDIDLSQDGLDFDGTLTLNDYETITIDVTSSAATTPTLLADINASSATTITFTNDDTYDAGDALTVTADLDGDDATIDLSGWDSNVGSQTGDIDLSSAGTQIAVATIAAQVLLITNANVLADFLSGIELTAADENTIILTDGRTSTELTVVSLNTAAATSGIDTIEFVNLSSDATDDIGDVVIDLGFVARDDTLGSVNNYSVLDFSAFTDVESVSDLIITASPDAEGDAHTIITSSEFLGVIFLVGVDSTELTTDNFIFA